MPKYSEFLRLLLYNHHVVDAASGRHCSLDFNPHCAEPVGEQRDVQRYVYRAFHDDFVDDMAMTAFAVFTVKSEP